MICKIKNTYLLNPGFERSRLKQCFQILDGLLYLYFSHCQILVYQWISYGINGGLGSKWSLAVSTCSQCMNMLLITCMVNSSSTAWCRCSIIHVYCDWSQTDEASIGPSVFLDILTSQSLWSSNRRRIKKQKQSKMLKKKIKDIKTSRNHKLTLCQTCSSRRKSHESKLLLTDKVVKTLNQQLILLLWTQVEKWKRFNYVFE